VENDALIGESIRDTYSDLIFDRESPEKVKYFEPAVLTPRNQDEANRELKLIADYLDTQDNLVLNVSYPDPTKIERTLVIIKPDNWKRRSARPGILIDMFSRTGLRIIGMKIHRFSIAQAMEFYQPVEEVLKNKLAGKFGKRAKELLEAEFNFLISSELTNKLLNEFGAECASDQFYQIIEFMSGMRPSKESQNDTEKSGDIKCLIMVYEGENAVKKIRDVLGATNPEQADEGSIRREFGTDVMKNSAHASDSMESYEREQKIVQISDNRIVSIIREYVK
jgi:nucleoside diphosphate kinase